MQEGDIVILQDSNQVRGTWRLSSVSRVFPGEDGRVHQVEVQHKNIPANEAVQRYPGHKYITVEQPVQKLIVIIPADEKD